MNVGKFLTNFKYKNELISFFILGLPFFMELFVVFRYHPPHFEMITYSPLYTAVEILVCVGGVFLSSYCLFIASNSKTIKKLVILTWIFILYIPVTLEFICAYTTGTFLSNDFMQAIFNTHLKEAAFIVKQYSVFIIISCAIIGYVFYSAVTKSISSYPKKHAILATILLLCSLAFSDEQPINRIILAFRAYIQDLDDIDKFSQLAKGLDGIKPKCKEKETYVLVIGESVDRNHMGIYGYSRPTTPCFEKIKDELFIFKNVTTAHVFTSAAVKSMLLLRDKSNQIHSFIKLFQSAGFKTFWFSNQGKWNTFDNSVMRFGKSCDEYAFVYGKDIIYSSENYNLVFKNEQRRLKLWDENLLKYFEKAIRDPSKKKLIVLHLKGSHCPIDARYPSEFGKFHLPTKYYDKEKATAVCLFDNSILYTDHILNEVINSLKKKGETSWMLYLSDHGQDINDTEECVLAARTWPHGYEVPFVVWLSEKYKKENADFIQTWAVNRKFVTDKTAYSLIDLARLRHPLLDLTDSIFSSQKTTKCKDE